MCGRSRSANYPRWTCRSSPSSVVLPFAATAAATPALLPSSKGRRLRRPSPHPRMIESFHQWLIESTDRTSGRGRTSPVMDQDHSSPGDCTHHPYGLLPITACPATGGSGFPSASTKGGVWRTYRPKCRLPESPCLAPSRHSLSPVLPATMPWLRTHDEKCVVRAESSVRARTRTGRLRRCVFLLSLASPFVHR